MTDYLTVAEVLAMHADQIERYGGSPGVRDQGLLEAALYRPQTGYYADLIEEAAALWESLAQNHSFARILFLPSTAYTSGRTPKRRTFLSPTFTRSTSSDSTNSFPGCAHTWKRRPNTHKRRGSAACCATTRECQKLGSGFGKDAFVVALAGGDEVAGAEGFFGADFPPLNDELRYAVPGEH